MSLRPQTRGLTSPSLIFLGAPDKRHAPDRHENSYPVHQGMFGALDKRHAFTVRFVIVDYVTDVAKIGAFHRFQFSLGHVGNVRYVRVRQHVIC